MSEEKKNDKQSSEEMPGWAIAILSMLVGGIGFAVGTGVASSDHKDTDVAFYKADRDDWVKHRDFWRDESHKCDAREDVCRKDLKRAEQDLSIEKRINEFATLQLNRPPVAKRRASPDALSWQRKAESCQKEIDDRIAEAKRDYQATETVLCFLEDGTGPGVQCHRFKKLVEGDVIKLSYGKLIVECDPGPDGYVITSKCRVVK